LNFNYIEYDLKNIGPKTGLQDVDFTNGKFESFTYNPNKI